ncbi:MAG: GH12 family glycosyl hydrolase domain-containing protein, partial [Pseudomonadota bacterium]
MGGRLTRDGETATLGGVVLANNSWGRGDLAAGRDYVQTVTFGDSLAEGVRFAWSWPDAAEGVRAFPELYAGRKPWGGPAGGDLLPLPVSVAAEGLTLRYETARGGETAGFNVALDIWIADRPDAGPAGIRQELMVWLMRGEADPAGAPVARLAAGDLAGALHVREGHAAGWTYLALVSDRPRPAGEIDLAALLDALAARGLVAPGSWLLTVELGAEVVRGEGWLGVTEFALDGPPGRTAAGAEALTLQPDPGPPVLAP